MLRRRVFRKHSLKAGRGREWPPLQRSFVRLWTPLQPLIDLEMAQGAPTAVLDSRPISRLPNGCAHLPSHQECRWRCKQAPSRGRVAITLRSPFFLRLFVC